MTYTCDARHQPAQPVLSIRTQTPVENLPRLLGQAFDKIIAHIVSLNEQPAGAPFVCYYNMDMQNLDVEIGFPVAVALPGKDDVQPRLLPEGMYAFCMYTGPYHEMVPAYEALNTWVAQHGYQATGVSYEYYLNSPDEVPVEQLQTMIVFPLK